MSMYRCPSCGELFSTSYKKCPFCEEDDLMSGRTAKKAKKRGGSRRKNEPHAVGPALVIVLLLIVALVVFLVKGGDILNALKRSNSNVPPVSDAVDETGDKENKDNEGEETEALTLSSAVLELDYGASATLEASGGSGSYTWSSDNNSVASVSEDGTVKGLSGGTATITVSDGESSANCVVTVKVETVELTMDKTDVSIRIGESFKLGAKGGTITYRSENTDIAVVGADGVVTGMGYGKTNVYASNGSMELSCIVRVK